MTNNQREPWIQLILTLFPIKKDTLTFYTTSCNLHFWSPSLKHTPKSRLQTLSYILPIKSWNDPKLSRMKMIGFILLKFNKLHTKSFSFGNKVNVQLSVIYMIVTNGTLLEVSPCFFEYLTSKVLIQNVFNKFIFYPIERFIHSSFIYLFLY